MHSRPTVVGIGELLWDLLPQGKHLGGAPANFCYIAAALGASSTPVSRIGNDELGRDAIRALGDHGLDTSSIQTDDRHPTGTVEVTLDRHGTPSYVIHENAAWDHIQWSSTLSKLASRADAICFGTLAQRSPVSRETIGRMLDAVPAGCLRIFDVNLRPPYFDVRTARESIAKSNVLKLNHEELPWIVSACGLPPFGELEAANALREYGSLRAVCITRGANGSVIATEEGTVVHPGFKVTVADTVGSGDAFTAAVAMRLLTNSPLNELSDFANRVASLVASRPGAMPPFSASDRALLAS